MRIDIIFYPYIRCSSLGVIGLLFADLGLSFARAEVIMISTYSE